MARGKRNNCRLCMKPTIRSESTTINNLPKTFAHILEEISGIKFTEADGIQMTICVRCRDFLQAMESHSEYPKANKISGAGRRKVRRLMDKGISAAEAIEKVIAEKRARDLLSGTGFPVQQNVPVENLINTQIMGEIQGRRLSGAQRKKFAKLVGGGMNSEEARILVLAASGPPAGPNQPPPQPQQRGPAVGGPGQRRVVPRNVLQKPNGPKTVVRNTTVQGGRVQKVTKVVATGAVRPPKVVGAPRAPQQKGPAKQQAGNGPVQKGPIQKGPRQQAANGPVQKAPIQKRPVPNVPANNAQPRQQQANAAGGRPQNPNNRPGPSPRRNDRPAPYNNNNRGNNNQQNQRGSGNGNFNQQDCPLEVGIVPFNFPNVQLDEMKLDALKEAITNEIVKIPPGGPLIRFLGTTFENGWLKLICADQLSHNWLASLVSRWERAGVRLVEGNSLPQPVVLSLYLPGDFRAPEEILNILEKQNNSLTTNQWRIINRETDANGQSITVCVDQQSLQALQSRDYMVFLGLGMVEFKPRRFPTDGAIFTNSNTCNQSNKNNSNNNSNNANMKNNSGGYSGGGNRNNGGNGGGSNGMGNNYQPNQNWVNGSGGGNFNRRQGVNQGQGFQRPGYQNQRSW